MCNYCGCREFPLIGQLSQEHWKIKECAGALRRVIIQNRYGDAANLLDELLALLLPHTATEEGGLFAELRVEGSLTGEVERLCAEHDEIHTVLGAIDRQAPDWRPRWRRWPSCMITSTTRSTGCSQHRSSSCR
ncbi:hemerythrin domain-containing protein [Actinomadura madurae]|uniref:hemerythrin domain-containing protein n=1 Tax=Actinomadura madurae TaxID=1993 RepID=UPI0020D1F94B|nr:hemerythrin domain-containing protein [Actinomadura madurae]MCP9978239.1 hemerythrin domain-containing protein [Actinomadura madurae]